MWGERQDAQFGLAKEMSATTPVLVPYSLTADTMLNAKSSSYGLGAAILQKVCREWKPLAYASRALTSAEKWYILRRFWPLHRQVTNSTTIWLPGILW